MIIPLHDEGECMILVIVFPEEMPDNLFVYLPKDQVFKSRL